MSENFDFEKTSSQHEDSQSLDKILDAIDTTSLNSVFHELTGVDLRLNLINDFAHSLKKSDHGTNFPTNDEWEEARQMAKKYLEELRNSDHSDVSNVIEHLVLIPEDSVEFKFRDYETVIFKQSGVVEVIDEELDRTISYETSDEFTRYKRDVNEIISLRDEIIDDLSYVPRGLIDLPKIIKDYLEVQRYKAYRK